MDTPEAAGVFLIIDVARRWTNHHEVVENIGCISEAIAPIIALTDVLRRRRG